MSRYLDAYQRTTGKVAPESASRLDPLFARMEAGELLPPRGQQAVDLGFSAHTFNDRQVQPPLFDYYQWVTTQHLATSPRELSAKLIGMAVTSANVFQSTLPQPVTLNPWQIAGLKPAQLMNRQAVVIENNGIFIWLVHRHPTWPLINQSGNDFNGAYVQVMRLLEQWGVRLTYLGDLDSAGIQIAAQLWRVLPQTTEAELLALQSPERVLRWLTFYGKADATRTQAVAVVPQRLQQEAQSIHTLARFVEQEQLISEYEQLIPQWLKA